MKKLFLLLIFTFPLWGLGGCDKDDKPTNPIDQLPPATQTGAGTFGCLVNGVPYVDNSGFFNCFYQLVDGEYYFGIDLEFEKELRNLNIGTNSVILSSGTDVILAENGVGEGEAIFLVRNGLYNIGTTTEIPGHFRVNYFNLTQNIISATFEFTVIDSSTGLIYEITEGRFDSHFTQ